MKVTMYEFCRNTSKYLKGEEIVITKRGKEYAKVVFIEHEVKDCIEKEPRNNILDTLKGQIKDIEGQEIVKEEVSNLKKCYSCKEECVPHSQRVIPKRGTFYICKDCYLMENV
jgi:antitoxin (DNA-binding transcriptional repressor) of toxin-antitoxin stability system